MRLLSKSSFLGVLFILTALSGCASKSDYGNFIAHDLNANQSQLGIDTAKELEKHYPPAKNYLILRQDTPDIFGKALVATLRKAGFAVQEFNPKGKKASPETSPATRIMPRHPKDPKQWRLTYIVDQAGEPDLYYVTLKLNHQVLTRLYRLDDNRFIPAGDWVWKKD